MPRLVNVKLDLKLPGLGGIQSTWEPDEAEVRAAWELYVGMVTRTPLGEFSSVEGSTRETLNSIYFLFDTTMAVLGGRMETPARARAMAGVDLAIIGVMADGGLRRSESAALTWSDVEFWPDGTARITVQKGKNQPDPATVALTETTARALRGIQPDGADPAAPVFGLTGETLANRIRAGSSSCRPRRRLLRPQRPHRHGPADGGRRSADCGGPAPRPMEARRYGRPLHPGRGGRGGPLVAELTYTTSP